MATPNWTLLLQKPQKQRKRETGQLNQSRPALEGASQDEAERKSSTLQTDAKWFPECTRLLSAEADG